MLTCVRVLTNEREHDDYPRTDKEAEVYVLAHLVLLSGGLEPLDCKSKKHG